MECCYWTGGMKSFTFSAMMAFQQLRLRPVIMCLIIIHRCYQDPVRWWSFSAPKPCATHLSLQVWCDRSSCSLTIFHISSHYTRLLLRISCFCSRLVLICLWMIFRVSNKLCISQLLPSDCYLDTDIFAAEDGNPSVNSGMIRHVQASFCLLWKQ